jgi:hypothetical protein
MQVANVTARFVTSDASIATKMSVANTTTLLADKFDKTGGAISGHLIPSANITYDLGSSTSAFRDLYLSGATLTLGGTKLQDTNGVLSIKSVELNKTVALSASGGLVVNAKTVVDADGNIDSDAVGEGFRNSTVFSIPTNLNGSDTFVGETSGSQVDAFGISIGPVYDCQEPTGRLRTTNYGFV